MKRYTLTFRSDETNHIISGETLAWKDSIKALKGAYWSRAEQAWRIPLTTSMDAFKDAYEKHIEATIPPWGQCCSAAELYSPNGGFDKSDPGFWMSSLSYVCPKHGVRSFSRKPGYTGD